MIFYFIPSSQSSAAAMAAILPKPKEVSPYFHLAALSDISFARSVGFT
jgi:hypothetical protein